MKTIDEVIDLFDNGCIRPCVECPCYGMKECQEQLAAESYYLHEYQKIEEEHAENVPLTWDELKKMEGKPVWVDCIDKRWIVIEEFRENGNGAEYLEATDGGRFSAKAQGDLWQAYRKERK